MGGSLFSKNRPSIRRREEISLGLLALLVWGCHGRHGRGMSARSQEGSRPPVSAAGIGDCASYPAYLLRQFGSEERVGLAKSVWGASCITTRQGVWAIEYHKVEFGSDCEDYGTDENPQSDCAPRGSGEYELVFVRKADRKTLRGRDQTLSGTLRGPRYGSSMLELTPLNDYNHDGIAELGVRFYDRGEGWYPHNAQYVITLENDELVHYGYLKGIDVEMFKDVDSDGLIDVLTYMPFLAYQPDSDQPALRHGPLLLLHAQPDGQFRRDSRPAILQARRQCPNKPLHGKLINRDAKGELDWDQTLSTIACARLYGLSPKSIQAAFGAVCDAPTAPRNCTDNWPYVLREVFVKWAESDPGLDLSQDSQH